MPLTMEGLWKAYERPSKGNVSTNTIHPAPMSQSPLTIAANIVRGALIGMAELVPGISGGTVALVVGIYERALHNGNALLRRKFSQVDWFFLAAVGVGMVTAVFTMSTVMHTFVEENTEYARGLFLGMVTVSIWVPLAMMDPRDVRKRGWVLGLVFVLAAALSFFATGFTSAPQTNPSLIVIFLAASIAICALVLPGISGSFFLMAVGLYSPVMGAISDRNWTVILTFAAGALLGIILFIRLLTKAMERYRSLTLTVMAGLMLGSLRALWPWQSPDAELLAPGDNLLPIVGLAVLGGAIVLAFIIADRVASARSNSDVVTETQPN